MTSKYYENLLSVVLDSSKSSSQEEAVLEWEVSDWDEDEEMETSCLCGKENIRYLFTIENTLTGLELEPIGSQCIKKFEREDLTDLTVTYEKLFKLKSALSNNEFIGLSSEYFSRKLIKYFFDEGVYNCEFNKYDGQNDYEFLIKMFNKKNKDSISKNQQRKINAIIINQIIPFLKELLEKDTQ